MSITVEERHQSRKAGDDWREYAYLVTGTDSEVAALNAVPGPQYISVPNPKGALFLPLVLTKTVSVEQQIDGPNINQHTWYATVRYEERNDNNKRLASWTATATAARGGWRGTFPRRRWRRYAPARHGRRPCGAKDSWSAPLRPTASNAWRFA